MKKKPAKRRALAKRSRSSSNSYTVHYFVYLSVIAVAFLAGYKGYNALQSPNVLGTKSYLAEDMGTPPGGGGGQAPSQPQQAPQQAAPPQEAQSQTQSQPNNPQPPQNNQPPQPQSQPNNPQPGSGQSQWQGQSGTSGQQQWREPNPQGQPGSQPFRPSSEQSNQGRSANFSDQRRQPENFRRGSPGEQSGNLTPEQRKQFENFNQGNSTEQFKNLSPEQKKQFEEFKKQESGNQQQGGQFGSSGQQPATGQQQFFAPQPFQRPEKLEVKTADGKIKIDLEREKAKVEFSQENGKIVVKARKADGTEVELGEDMAKHITDTLGDSLPAIERGRETNSFVLRRGATEAKTNFPVSVDVTTGALTVTTPAGQRTVTVLPDQAVQRLMTNNIITKVETSTTAGANGATTQKVELTTINDQPVFKIEGSSQEKFLGFIPVSISKTAFVSADQGQVVRTDETFFNRILGAISF